jgi:RNA polymerase sigma factor (sigma-70 family)
MKETDEKLMRAYQLGESRAFETLYHRYSPKVYGYVRGRMRDPGAADDVFQAVFMKLHQSRNLYDTRCAFAPWLFTIARTVLIDHMRKAGRNEETPVEDIEALAEPVEMNVSTGSSALGVDMSVIPERQQQILAMRYQDDLSFEEIAEKLSTTPANIRQLVSRAVRRLKALQGKKGRAND